LKIINFILNEYRIKAGADPEQTRRNPGAFPERSRRSPGAIMEDIWRCLQLMI